MGYGPLATAAIDTKSAAGETRCRWRWRIKSILTSQLQQVARSFKSTFMSRDPVIVNVPGNIKNSVAQAIAHAHNQIMRERGYTHLFFAT
jgi:hypothetical protein